MPAPLRIIYAGTPDFAVPALQTLIDSDHDVIAVYTQPDRPAGRGRKLTPSPVKQVAVEHNIPVYQPLNFKAEQDQQALKALHADLMVVAAYGLLLPQVILDAPKYGCLNIHASILPRWRGAAPIHRAILAGDKETGVTIMQMALGLDTGDMLVKYTCPIEEDETGQSLHDKLAALGGPALLETLNALQNGTLNPEAQNDNLSNYAKKLSKEEALIDWSKPAVEIERQVRAFNPWPVAQTPYADGMMRIWFAKALEQNTQAKPGQVIHESKDGIDVATGEGVLRLMQIQLPGKKVMDAQSFLNATSLQGVTFS